MIQTLQCPSCGAPLEYDPSSQSDTIRCPFCANVAVLPSRPRQQNIHISLGGSGLRKGSPKVVLIFAAVILLIAGGILIGVINAVSRAVTGTRAVVDTPVPRSTLAPPGRTAPNAKAEPTPFFGSDGIGPGHFKDARSIALDPEGRIYIGEYSGGRIQVFDSAGKFVTQWTTIDPKMPLRGMTADRRGNVYVVQKGDITRYEGATGKQLGTTGAGQGHYDDVVSTPDGGLVAFARQSSDDLVKLDGSGQVRQVIRAAVSTQTDHPELSVRVAADGVGNVYALSGGFDEAVFKFAPDGRFLTRFGGTGDEPGQFRAPSAVAVDNQGRVYVTDFKGVQVFDPNGRYLELITIRGAGAPSGLAFNDKNELFVVARTAVFKFQR
jgi:streptogramin lyase